jgi:hypothetical protein
VDLRELQSVLWRLITAPTGAAAGAAELVAEGEIPAPDLAGLVRGDARLRAIDRVDVYADMYFYRLRDCLAEDFPRLAAVLGDVDFHNLVTDYLLAHPSRHWSLRELGCALPDFVPRRDLACLAALEWARVDVFDAADAEPVAREGLVALGAEARLWLVPAARLLRLDAGTLDLWKGEPPDRTGGACAVRVWRQDFRVYHCAIPADEERCLQAVAATGGATLAELGELAARPERLAALLETWLGDGILTARDPGYTRGGGEDEPCGTA